MKLPFAFATRLFFRILLPGAVLALFVYPAAEQVTCWFNLRPDAALLYPLLSIALGWLVSLADMPIYMLFEGRRMWPSPLFEMGLKHQAARLLKWQKRADEHHGEAVRYRKNGAAPGVSGTERDAALAKEKFHALQRTEAALHVNEYPLGPSERREALFPTRLGNILAEYETYPTRKYGLDGVFYWFRLWVGLPKDLREELDEFQALVDGVLYVAFCLICGAAVLAIYRVIDSVFASNLLKSPWGSYWLLLSALSIAASYALYLIALPAQKQHGNFFKAMFDPYHPELNIQPALDEISDRERDPRVRSLKGRSAYYAAWKYLQWHKFQPAGEKNRDIAEYTRQS